MITPSWFLLLTVLAAGLAVFDAAGRMRGKRGTALLPIAELAAAGLMLLSLFVTLPAPFGTFLFALILEAALVLVLVVRGSGRKAAPTISIVALVLNTVVVLVSAGWLHIPGLV